MYLFTLVVCRMVPQFCGYTSLILLLGLLADIGEPKGVHYGSSEEPQHGQHKYEANQKEVYHVGSSGNKYDAHQKVYHVHPIRHYRDIHRSGHSKTNGHYGRQDNSASHPNHYGDYQHKPHQQQSYQLPHRLSNGDQSLWQGPPSGVPQPRYRELPTEVTAVVGETAQLPCGVTYLADRTVTWMRQRDLHILTADVLTYSADTRFRVVHAPGGWDWTLEILYATPQDSGVYECQVNSDPKVTRTVTLTVKERNQLDDPGGVIHVETSTEEVPQVSLEGLKEVYIEAGSVLSLTCVVRHAPGAVPHQLLWFHDSQNIDYDSPRGGVSIQTEKFKDKMVSQLLLSTVRITDNGEYFCAPTDMHPASVTVHVVHGDRQHAAVQQAGINTGTNTCASMLHFLAVAMIVLHYIDS